MRYGHSATHSSMKMRHGASPWPGAMGRSAHLSSAGPGLCELVQVKACPAGHDEPGSASWRASAAVGPARPRPARGAAARGGSGRWPARETAGSAARGARTPQPGGPCEPADGVGDERLRLVGERFARRPRRRARAESGRPAAAARRRSASRASSGPSCARSRSACSCSAADRLADAAGGGAGTADEDREPRGELGVEQVAGGHGVGRVGLDVLRLAPRVDGTGSAGPEAGEPEVELHDALRG